MLIAKPDPMYQAALNASHYNQCFLIRWTVTGSFIADKNTLPLEASFVILANSLNEAMMFEMARLMKDQEGHVEVDVSGYTLDESAIAACMRGGASITDLRPESSRIHDQLAADAVEEYEERLTYEECMTEHPLTWLTCGRRRPVGVVLRKK